MRTVVAESTLKKCRRHPKHGVYLWTAGRRVTSKHGSSFIWMVNARIYPMTYSHWKSGQPDNLHGREGCVNLWWGSGYRWSDLSCDVHVCFVCERSRWCEARHLWHLSTLIVCYSDWHYLAYSLTCVVRTEIKQWTIGHQVSPSFSSRIALPHSLNQSSLFQTKVHT